MSIKTCFVAATRTPFRVVMSEITSGVQRWRRASSMELTLSGWMSSWMALFGSKVTESFCPGRCSTDRVRRSKMLVIAERLDSVCETVDEHSVKEGKGKMTYGAGKRCFAL